MALALSVTHRRLDRARNEPANSALVALEEVYYSPNYAYAVGALTQIILQRKAEFQLAVEFELQHLSVGFVFWIRRQLRAEQERD